MSTELDFIGSDFDPDNWDDRVSPGKAHLLIQDIDPYAAEGTKVTVDYEVLAHEKDTETGKTGTESFFLNSKKGNVKRLVALAIALGITTLEKMAEAKRRGVNPKLDFTQGIGRQICTEIEKNDKGYVGFAFDRIYAPDDPRAKDYPKHQQMLQRQSSGEQLDQLDGLGF